MIWHEVKIHKGAKVGQGRRKITASHLKILVKSTVRIIELGHSLWKLAIKIFLNRVKINLFVPPLPLFKTAVLSRTDDPKIYLRLFFSTSSNDFSCTNGAA